VGFPKKINCENHGDESCLWKIETLIKYVYTRFYILMTVHLSIILVNNQLDTHNFFCIYLFGFSPCFEQPCAHHRESQFYQYNIWSATKWSLHLHLDPR